MARSRTRKSPKKSASSDNQVLGPRPFQDAARKGLAWSLTGIANAQHYQAKALSDYGRRTKSQLSATEYAKVMKCASAIDKVHLILYELAAEMDAEIARRWKRDPTIHHSPSVGRRVQEPAPDDASEKQNGSRKPSAQRRRRTASSA